MFTLPKQHMLPIFICTVLAGALISCGQAETVSLSCPFTDMDWDSTAEDIIAEEGEGFSTYDSIYGGLCYTWPKEYEGCMGTVKYMFDEENRLVNVAWAYSAENMDALTPLYDAINTSVHELYGDSGDSPNGVGNYGNVWHLESGDIILSVMVSSEFASLQYAYMHPRISNIDKAGGSASAVQK